MPKARDELIAMQKRWVADLKERIYDSQGRHTPELDRYYQEYRNEFRHGYERVATRAELERALSQADIAYFGDYHTLKIAQLTVKTLLEEVIEGYGRRVVLGLEMLHTEHQREADQYLANELSESEFLEAIDYDNTWGFEWPNYRILFDLAREHGAKVLALNSSVHKKKERKKSLALRDERAAALIAAASLFYPDSLIAVVFGDLHVGQSHLPAQVREVLAARNIERRDLIIYQNSETFYWSLVDEGKELVVDAVKVGKGKYCVMNATPLVKFQSYMNWQDAAGELSYGGLDNLGYEYRGTTDLSQQFFDIVEEIASFLKIEAEGLDDFDLYTTGDLSFLSDLVQRKVYSAAEIDNLKAIIAKRHSAFFPRARLVYLGSLSLNDASEMAAKFIRFNCVDEEYEGEHSAREAFYVNVLDEALGVFGAMVMNPRYRVPAVSDYVTKLESFHRRRLDNEEEAIERDVCKHVIAHAKMIRRLLENDWAHDTLRAIYKLEATRFRRVTRALGAQLGGQLFSAVNGGYIEIDQVRSLFFEVWEQPFERYMALRYQLALVPENVRGMSDSL